MKISEKDKKMFNIIFDVPLDASHPRYKLQKRFFEFAEEYPQIKVETADLYNDGDCVSIHFDNDEFIVLCAMDSKEIEISILLDYEEATFNVIETIPFSWESLRSRLNDLITVSPWTITFDDGTSGVNEIREKATQFLKQRWKQK